MVEQRGSQTDDTNVALLWVDLETSDLREDNPFSLIFEATFATTNARGDMLNSFTIVPPYPKNLLDWSIGYMGDWCRDTHTKSGLIDTLYERSTESVDPLESFELDKLSGGEVTWMETLRAIANSQTQTAIIEKGLPTWLSLDGGGHKLYMAGSSVHFDRRWLAAHWPDIESGFDYHNLDVSSIRKAARLLRPDLDEQEPEVGRLHRTFSDICDSIRYYKFAQEKFFNMQGVEDAGSR